MAAGGYLVPPPGDEKASVIWAETKKRVDRFLPDLFADIFPRANLPPVTAFAAQKSEVPSIPPPYDGKETTNDAPAPVKLSENDRRESTSPEVPPEQAST